MAPLDVVFKIYKLRFAGEISICYKLVSAGKCLLPEMPTVKGAWFGEVVPGGRIN
jgi:hypothetical protein